VRSTKAKSAPLETCDTSQLHGKKVRDVYTETYMVRETMFSDQTGQFPTRSQRGSEYIMVMVEINSNTILVEPMKSRKDEEMIRAYNALLIRLKRAGIVLKECTRANPDARIRPLTHASVDRAHQAESVGRNSLLSILFAICRSPNL
jgi:hypothetical protein